MFWSGVIFLWVRVRGHPENRTIKNPLETVEEIQNILAGAGGFCSDRELHGDCSIGIVWVRLKNNLEVNGEGISVQYSNKLRFH